MADDVDVQARLQALEDRQKIADLIADYCRGVDRGDDALLRSTYWPDAVDDHGAGDSPAMAFCDRVLPILRDSCLSTMHLVANSRVELAGDQAFGETYVIAYHVLTSARVLDTFMGAEAAQAVREAFPQAAAGGGPFDYNAGARFLDRFERRGGEWRFAHRRVVFDWAEAQPGSVAFTHINRTRGRKDGADPSYALFAALAAAS
ncbi:MAG: hypothetical protein GC203_19485 [Phenylobacterium sp.]|uniref:nuclear transport factor 2 family protein n=1 Tax=Phenylobacterium sp. TaxID=1871053 RepID=UPI0025E208F0|nr:nuclear transport factor 2 family protein [Phenylobacterium sp.]MBI1200047.1 hypothetical protein [Phenylobacterium sp.]